MYQVYEWTDNNELKTLNTCQYWNNENAEKKKEWDIRDGNFQKMENYLTKSGLKNDLKRALRLSGLCSQKALKGIELGGGVCWSAPFVFHCLDMEEMQFLEFSWHRIAKIAPLILEHYQIPEDRVKLVSGSFYEIKCPDESMDFVLLSQALHHADDVERLLTEAHRVLKKGRVALIIGEHNKGVKFCLKCMTEILRDIVIGDYHSQRISLYGQSGCLAVDKRLGDRYYALWSYAKMFRKHGFTCRRIRTAKEEHFGFILWKK